MEIALDKSLHALVRDEGSLEEVRSLLKEEVNIEERDRHGCTPLLIAAQEGNKGAFELLISAGANINCRSEDRWTLLHYAALHEQLDKVQYLIDKGVAVDEQTDFGNTPLLIAARGGKKDACELFIKAGADINAKNLLGNTPLLVALDSWNGSQTVDNLLTAGADYNFVNKHGESPLYLLMKENKIDAIRLCLEMGACVDDFDSEKFQELPFLKEVFLKDAKMCAKAIINKFNKRDLPALYEVSAVNLPPVDKLRMEKGSWMALEVEQAVSLEIQAKGHCDVVRARPMVLSMLAARSFAEAIKSRGMLKRLNSDKQQSSKKMRLEK